MNTTLIIFVRVFRQFESEAIIRHKWIQEGKIRIIEKRYFTNAIETQKPRHSFDLYSCLSYRGSTASIKYISIFFLRFTNFLLILY